MADSTPSQDPTTAIEEPSLASFAPIQESAPAPESTPVTLKDEDEVVAVIVHEAAAIDDDDARKSDNSNQHQHQHQQELTDHHHHQQQQQQDHGVAAATSSKLPPPISFGSFKEESNKAIDLRDSEKKALDDLKNLVRIAIDNGEFTFPSPPPPPPAQEQTLESETPPPAAAAESEATSSKPPGDEEVFIWGVPLLHDERSEAILLKFLRARDFKVKETFIMLKNTLKWRKENKIDAIVNESNEDAEDDLEKAVFMHGFDREGHPVCYNVYGEFQNEELYQKLFSDEAKRREFLKQRVMFLERSIRKLDFSPGGVCTIFQVNDFKNAPGPGKRELRIATKQALQLLQDNYPEFVAKQVFINVPWWYLAFYTIVSPFMTQRTKSKFVFAGPARSAETLLKYIAPEQLPVQFGGLSVDSCDCNPEFSMDDIAVEVDVKPGTKQIVEIIIYETCTLVWELRVVGWEVTYGAEFVPNAKDAYTVIIQKASKISHTDNPVISNSFKVTELGKVLLTVGNPTSKNKKLIYRYYVKPLSEK